MPKPRTYEGKEITVSFDMSRCIHARNCFLKLPQVFDPAQRPWVQPDAAPAEEIAAMIRTCPSGALGFETKGAAQEVPTLVNRATVWENGPLAVQGAVKVAGEDMTRVTLCRCGKSANKPYCDYAHVEVGFTATGEPAAQEAAEGRAGEGALSIEPIPNGPLKAEGPLEVTTGTGRRVSVGEKAFLCRCGASKNKPFCDGAHKDIGFES